MSFGWFIVVISWIAASDGELHVAVLFLSCLFVLGIFKTQCLLTWHCRRMVGKCWAVKMDGDVYLGVGTKADVLMEFGSPTQIVRSVIDCEW